MSQSTHPRYRPYPAYKPSGVKWLGDIPEEWETFFGKRLFVNRREQALPEDAQLAASQAYGVVPQSVMMKRNNAKVMLATKGTQSFRHVEKNDFVISLRSFEGGVEHSHYVGCVSPAYTVLCPIRNTDPLFFRYLLKSSPFVSALQATTDSLRDGKAISYQQFGGIPLNRPSAAEQIQIAAFLDYETAKIDELIAKQQRLIALLEEKRQAVISHAVTKGLNPNAPLSPSGIDWLGDVPAHWKVKRAKHVSEIFIPQRNKPDLNVGDGVAWATMEDMKSKLISKTLLSVDQKSAQRSGSKVLPKGSVIASCVGNFGVASINQVDVIINQQLQAFIPHGIQPEFLREIVFQSKAYFEQVGTAATLVYVNQQGFENLPVLLPPKIEQCEIQEFVAGQDLSFSELQNKAQSAITLLKERRTSLISAAVTGKIDVREWKAPQELSEEIINQDASA